MKKLSNWFAKRLMPGDKGEKGAINIASILMMGIGMVFLAVGFIMFPIVTDATDDLLAWECSANTSITDESFTGFTEVIGITPLLILLGFVAAGIFAMYLGIKISKGATGNTSVNLGAMLMLALAIVFIAVALIIMPVALDGICETYDDVLTGSNDYTGLGDILAVTPLLLLIAFVGAAVVSGFFGIKKLGSGG